jgi:hypothetical protein
MGFYWEDATFDAGTHLLEGDLVVAARPVPGLGRPPRVTFAPGATIEVAPDDATRGGASHDQVEIVNHGELVAVGTPDLPVTFRSAAAVPGRGDWYGLVLAADAAAAQVSGVTLANASYGVRLEGGAHLVEAVTATECETAVHAEGGAPVVRDVHAEDCDVGVAVVDADGRIERLRAWRSDVAGLYAGLAGAADRAVAVDGCLLVDGAGDGVSLYKDGAGTLTLALDRCTVWGNRGAGAYFDDRTWDGRLALALTAGVVAGNHGYAVAAANRGGEGYQPRVSWERSVVWGNAAGERHPRVIVTEGAAVLRDNPLLVDPAAGDFAPTERSPARCLDAARDDRPGGGDGRPDAAGWLDWEGAATDALVGWLHGDLTLTAAGSPWDLPGDLVVADACSAAPATLRVEAGATLRFAVGVDRMGGGRAPALPELRVHGRLELAGTAAAPVRLGSAADAPAPGFWQGVVVASGASVEARGFLVEWAVDGFGGAVAPGDVYEDGLVRDGAGWGFRFDAGADATLRGCRAERNAAGGVYLGDLEGISRLERLTLVGNGSASVWAQDSSAVLVNSVLVGSGYGVVGYQRRFHTVTLDVWNNTLHDLRASGVWTANVAPGGDLYLRAMNNQLTSCAGFAFLDVGLLSARADVDWNNFHETLNWERGFSHYGVRKGPRDFSAPPGYVSVDPSGRGRWYDLRLAPGSAVIDRGVGRDWEPLVPEADALGVARPQLAGTDPGAFEYAPDVANADPLAVVAGDPRVARWDPWHESVACFDGAGSSDPDGDPLRFAWDFGDGAHAEGPTACHGFPTAGAQEVVLVVTDGRGGQDHAVWAVEVGARPVADAGPPGVAEAGGAPAAFDGSASYDVDGTVVRWEWDFGDGARGEGPTPTHPYAAGPTREVVVTLVVTDDDGWQSAPAETVVRLVGAYDDTPPVLRHTPVADGQVAGLVDVPVAADVHDPGGVAAVEVVWRREGDLAWTRAPLAPDGVGGDGWRGAIPAAAVDLPAVAYYLDAADVAGNRGTHPAGAPEAVVHRFTVVPDDRGGPTIAHMPVAHGRPASVPVAVVADVTDPSGVAWVRARYRRATTATFRVLELARDAAGSTWRGEIPAVFVLPPGMQYYLETADLSPSGWESLAPADGPRAPHFFTVARPDGDPPTIVVVPVPDGRVAGRPVVVAARVTDPSGVAAVTLHHRPDDGAAGAFEAVEMVESAVSGTWTGVIPGAAVAEPAVAYYVAAADATPSANGATWPALGTETPASFTVVPPPEDDHEGPVLEHVPVADGQPEGAPVRVAAIADDPSGVAAVTLHVAAEGGGWQPVPLAPGPDGLTWAADLPGAWVRPPAVSYALEAVDASPNANGAWAPAAGTAAPYEFAVEPAPAPDVVGGADAGGGVDAGVGVDAGAGADAGGGVDAGGEPDAGGTPDAGAAEDAGPPDAVGGADVGAAPDAAVRDVPGPDAAPSDAPGAPDAPGPDAAAADTRPPDAAPPADVVSGPDGADAAPSAPDALPGPDESAPPDTPFLRPDGAGPDGGPDAAGRPDAGKTGQAGASGGCAAGDGPARGGFVILLLVGVLVRRSRRSANRKTSS